MDYDSIKDGLLSVVDSALKYGSSADPDAEFEVYVCYQSSAEAEITQGVVAAKSGVVAGNAVRVAKGRRVGFACSSGATSERVKLSIREALGIVHGVSVEDERFPGFVEPRPPGREGVLADSILELDVETLVRDCQRIVEEAKATDGRVVMVSAEASAGWGGYAVGNTNGVMAASRGGLNLCTAYVMTKVGEERKTGLGFDIARDRAYNVDGIGRDATSEAASQHGASPFDATTTMTTVWSPRAAGAFLLASVGRSTLGRPVVEGVSPLCDHIGEQMASKALTIYDDGQDPVGLNTQAVDAEGSPQKKNVVIERGVLKGFLFDHYHAKVFGVESTGNCARGRELFGGNAPYESSPSVGTKGLVVKEGRRSPDDLIASVDGKAVLITEMPIGIFHSNIATGEFSAVATSAFLVVNGSVEHPLRSVSVAGHFYDGLRELASIGSDTTLTPFGVTVPTMVFEGFSVTG